MQPTVNRRTILRVAHCTLCAVADASAPAVVPTSTGYSRRGGSRDPEPPGGEWPCSDNVLRPWLLDLHRTTQCAACTRELLAKAPPLSVAAPSPHALGEDSEARVKHAVDAALAQHAWSMEMRTDYQHDRTAQWVSVTGREWWGKGRYLVHDHEKEPQEPQ